MPVDVIGGWARCRGACPQGSSAISTATITAKASSRLLVAILLVEHRLVWTTAAARQVTLSMDPLRGGLIGPSVHRLIALLAELRHGSSQAATSSSTSASSVTRNTIRSVPWRAAAL